MNEPDEFFMVQLAHAVNADIAIGQARGTVENDDPEPTLLVAPAKVAEGDAGLTNMVFRLLLSTASSREVTVNYATSDGTAIAEGDYVGTNGVIKFAPGVTRLTIDVAVKGDFTPEPDELFFVNLITPVNARIVSGQGQASGVIQNDDLLPLLSISDGGVTEPVSGGANAILIVRLSSASSETVTVEYATTNGTALAGKDYAGQSGILTMPPGATTTNVSIQILADGKADGDKAFYVQLRNPTKAVLDDASGQMTLFQSGGTEKTMTLGVRRISQNKLELYLTGLENQTRQIQASYDLMDWQTITNATGSGWSMPLPETPSTQHSYRFYKAVSP
jgi:chitinase